MKKNKKIKTILIISWIVLAIFGLFLILRHDQPKLLKDERVDALSVLQDKTEYNFVLQENINTEYSPLYKCNSDIIPSYLESLASKIDSNLQKIEKSPFVKWQNNDSQDILIYNIDTATLHLYLENYPNKINFTSVERFISNYLDQDIQYYDIKIQSEDNQKIYSANRSIGENELVTGFGYSDFFYVIDGYLNSARILLAQIEEIDTVVPLIDNKNILQQYLNDPVFPKNVVTDTSRVVKATPETYEDLADPDLSYETCFINGIEPKLYYYSCNNNYIYYTYKIDGVCDVTYQDTLYSTPFEGFINAIDPEYVKSIE
jgi:hypothetical protein